MGIVGVLLAAGQGSRFGGDKLLATLADGTPIGVQAARNLKAALSDVIAVVRPDDAALIAALEAEGIEVAPCANAADGMGTSLAHAVRSRAAAAGWIVALADMPRVRPETIRAIAAALESGAAIVAPTHRGERGHPVGFCARYGGRLVQLSGDVGAREIVRAERAHTLLLECDDAGVLADVDTPSDLARISEAVRTRSV